MLCVAIPSYSEVLFLLALKIIALAKSGSQSLLIQRSYSYRRVNMKNRKHYSRNPFLFRGPIPTVSEKHRTWYWHPGRNPFLFRGPIPTPLELENIIQEQVAIPSYSEVLFLHAFIGEFLSVSASQSLLIQRSYSYYFIYNIYTRDGRSRNPFLFRGPIPTKNILVLYTHDCVAIPSYSEVLFLRGKKWKLLFLLLCRNPFLFRGPIPTFRPLPILGRLKKSQSLLIQRSYSYLFSRPSPRFQRWSQSLLIQRSYSYIENFSAERELLSRNPFLFRGPIPTTNGGRLGERLQGRNPFLFRGPIPTDWV